MEQKLPAKIIERFKMPQFPAFNFPKGKVGIILMFLILDYQVFLVRSANGTQNFVSTQFFNVPKTGLSDIENTK